MFARCCCIVGNHIILSGGYKGRVQTPDDDLFILDLSPSRGHAGPPKGVRHGQSLNSTAEGDFDSTSINWMISYLEGREQVVDISGTTSSPLPVNCGVPQGSIQGPSLFLLYINNMLHVTANCSCSLMTR